MADKKIEKIRVPWKGPIDDEWDSPGYNEFWGPTEVAVNKQIEDARKASKEIEIIHPDNS
jgi:hypothetical protein